MLPSLGWKDPGESTQSFLADRLSWGKFASEGTGPLLWEEHGGQEKRKIGRNGALFWSQSLSFMSQADPTNQDGGDRQESGIDFLLG